MNMRISLCLFAAALLPLSTAHAAQLTGRASLFGSAARAGPGDIGNTGSGDRTLTSDQQSLRLMLDDAQDKVEWSLHVKTARQHLRGFPPAAGHSSDLFRYHPWAGDWVDKSGADSSTRVGYELDRAVYKRRFGQVAASLGRQPIDWGSGRFWQPMNVFGAFAPTDLDTDFKPGIDAAVVDWFPSAFSSLTAAYALSPRNDKAIDDSAAVRYRRQVGERSEMALLAGRVIGNDVAGASFETDWAGLGWRIEGVRYQLEQPREHSVFWIAGVDYQFGNGTSVIAEWYENSRGAADEPSLAAMQSDRLVASGLQPQLGRRVLGLSAEKDITPLVHGSYKLFLSPLEDADGRTNTSLLHQLSFVYSVSNESDLLLSLLYASGKGLDAQGQPRSEFGHQPASVTLRLRYYF
ncbi:MAG: hypothetical protein IPJ21_13740 [Sterolibacteriaceae bacterium]|nr:hypothetical protein [Sterolibacteriaceae bacterium]MBK9084844.1 hypothetical protein [Sterolibacteriaceae bacterium]